MTQVLRLGSRGEGVRRWQNYLIGRKHLRGVSDGIFGKMTERATRTFQRRNSLAADGVVGPQTFAIALQQGFDPGLEDTSRSRGSISFPPPPEFGPLTGTAARQKVFGKFTYTPAPTSGNPEAIKVSDAWRKRNIVRLQIPQLRGVPVGGRPSSGTVYFHRLAADQFAGLWEAWESEGLLDLVLTFDGAYAPRFIRGSTKTLSNHAFASAFDINAKWNPLGAIPALVGKEGSVRELVRTANRFGFYWGGHFKQRPDGMHFEVAKLI